MIEILWGNPNDEIPRLRKKYKSKSVAELKQKAAEFDEQGVVACTACAYLILTEARRLGDNGKILDFDVFPDDDEAGHCVVVLDSMGDGETVLNSGLGIYYVKKVALQNGTDVTQEIMSEPIQRLT